MKKRLRAALAAVALVGAGCTSPYYTDRGALVGGVTGTGVGALVGEAVGHPGVGALVGAGVGTLTGAAVGNSLDNIEARNRAQIAATLGRQVPPGNVALPDVIAMTQAGVNEELIVNHIRTNGIARPLQSGDLIALQSAGVSPRVIAALQAAPQPGAPGPPALAPMPPPYAVPAYYPYPPPYWGPGPYYYYGWRPRPVVGWGVSVGGPL
jgi:hypothetical protein